MILTPLKNDSFPLIQQETPEKIGKKQDLKSQIVFEVDNHQDNAQVQGTDIETRDVLHSNLHKLYDGILPAEVQSKATAHQIDAF